MQLSFLEVFIIIQRSSKHISTLFSKISTREDDFFEKSDLASLNIYISSFHPTLGMFHLFANSYNSTSYDR